MLVHAAVLGFVYSSPVPAGCRSSRRTSQTMRVAGINPSRAAEAASRTATRQAVDRYWDAARVAAADPARIRAAFAHINDNLVEATEREAGAGRENRALAGD